MLGLYNKWHHTLQECSFIFGFFLLLLLFWFGVFWDRLSWCSSCCPRTCSEYHASLKLMRPACLYLLSSGIKGMCQNSQLIFLLNNALLDGSHSWSQPCRGRWTEFKRVVSTFPIRFFMSGDRPQTIKLLIPHKCNFATVMNHNVNIRFLGKGHHPMPLLWKGSWLTWEPPV